MTNGTDSAGVPRDRNMIGRVSIVTGGASGIGRAVAVRLAAMGSSVVIVDSNRDGADAAASGIVSSGGKAFSVTADVCRRGDVEQMVAEAAALGPVDALVHSAGIGIERPFLETTAKEWSRIIETDLTGTFLCCQAVASHMAANGYGRIVNLASTAGIRGGTGRAAYGAAKGGVIALTKTLALECAPKLRVNAVGPAVVDTAFIRGGAGRSDESADSIVDLDFHKRVTPMGRVATPEDIAGPIRFLLGADSGFMTGQVLWVNGGAYMP